MDGDTTITNVTFLKSMWAVATIFSVLPALAEGINACSCSCCEVTSVNDARNPKCGNVVEYKPMSDRNPNPELRSVKYETKCDSLCQVDAVEFDSAKFCYDKCYAPQSLFVGALCSDKKPDHYERAPVAHLNMRRVGVRQSDLPPEVEQQQAEAGLTAT